MIYGAETWATTKKEKRLEVYEMRLLRRMLRGVTRKDKIKNEYIRGVVGVANISGKVTERLLNWFRHVRR